MIDLKACDWLMANADAPIRYRITRELLGDINTAKKIEIELLENSVVKLWLKNLNPQNSPKHYLMLHGSFDFCLENALLKTVQLGLHTEIPQFSDAINYYTANYSNDIFSTNLLTLSNPNVKAVNDCILIHLDRLYNFTKKGDYDFYLTDEEKAKLKNIPKNFKNKKVIKKELFESQGFIFHYPTIYDIVGLHKLYDLKNSEIDEKINTVIDYISTDEFHNKIFDNYGILQVDDKRYLSMGWDPKYPGWFDLPGYMETGDVPKLLFFAQYISKYPVAVKTKWYADLLNYIEKYRTETGTYLFPAKWLKESTGYEVQGHHMSFGENRRKKNWREIESTFYVQLLQQNLCH